MTVIFLETEIAHTKYNLIGHTISRGGFLSLKNLEALRVHHGLLLVEVESLTRDFHAMENKLVVESLLSNPELPLIAPKNSNNLEGIKEVATNLF